MDKQDSLVVPAAIEAVVAEFESRTSPFTELQVQGELGKTQAELKEPTDAENTGAWAEVLAFRLMPSRQRESPWGTYDGPMGSGTQGDGTPFYSPDITGTPGVVIEHWVRRASTVQHPVLRARYSDLAWDLAPAISKTKRNPENARIACDAYLDSATSEYRAQAYEQFAAIQRALNLAILIKDTERAKKAKVKLLQQHQEAMLMPNGQWTIAFDRLMEEKNAGVTGEDRVQLVADLEMVVSKHSDTNDAKIFNPHNVQFAANRLIKHYERLNQREDVKRLHVAVGKAFEHFASLSDPLLASAVLQISVDSYRAAGLSDESRRVRALMQERTEQARDQMQPITAEIEITNDDMDAFLAGIVRDNLGATLARIASEFLPKRSQLEKQVQEMAEQAPLMAYIDSSIMADDHVVAKLGSVEEDPYGHLVRQANMTFTLSNIWLYQALEKTMEVFNPVPEHFVGWANRHGLWDDVSLLVQGGWAWVEGDFTKAIHILIPQIEKGLRGIVGQLGRPTTKAHPTVAGASVVLNMGDILYNEELKKVLGEDISLYFTALYADPRGLNLRNQLAHGLLQPEDMTEGTANLLIHTLLLFGVWKELATARQKGY